MCFCTLHICLVAARTASNSGSSIPPLTGVILEDLRQPLLVLPIPVQPAGVPEELELLEHQPVVVQAEMPVAEAAVGRQLLPVGLLPGLDPAVFRGLV